MAEDRKKRNAVDSTTSERTALSRYLSDIRGVVRLTREEEQQLSDGASVNRREVERRLVKSTLPFVIKVSQEYRGLGLSFEDILCEGNLGLMEAARRYDANRGTRFSTYAVWWIRKSILSALSSKVDLVRLPSAKKKSIRKIREAESDLHRTLGRAPSLEEISDHLNEGLTTVEHTLQHRRKVISLDHETGDRTSHTLHELIGDCRTTPEENLLSREERGNLGRALSLLPPRERIVLERRFGIDTEKSMTLNDIGREMGLSRERVRQIESQARERLRRLLARKGNLRSPPRRDKPASARKRRLGGTAG